jgi:YhgE/Pip-like protein
MGSHSKPEPDATEHGGPTPNNAGPDDSVPAERTRSDLVIPALLTLLRSPRFWAFPLIVVAVVMTVLAFMYVGAVTKPTANLHNFPIALVNDDAGGIAAPGEPQQNLGQQIADGLVKGTDPHQFNLKRISSAAAYDELDSGKVYGAIIISNDFTDRALSIARAIVLDSKSIPPRPTITVITNPRAGPTGGSIVGQYATTALGIAGPEFGKQFTAAINQQLQQMGKPPLTSLQSMGLANPIDVQTKQTISTDGNGSGLTAFYFTLLLVLAGFTGAMIVQTLVDGSLGVVPSEIGPFYLQRTDLGISRWGTLVIKWFFMFLVALMMSSLYILACHLVGMDMPNMFTLWMFSVLAITAVGVTCTSVMAAFGGVGMIINLIVFVVLGVPSSGATLPLEASPRLFTWLSWFEPMHQLYLGVRSIIYFGADFGAGLGISLIMTVVGLLIGIALGLLATKFYDWKGWSRGNAKSPASELTTTA